MLYGKYQFICQLIDDAILPPFKGSTLRGVFGRALKKVVCALKKETCTECLLKKECLYSLVFEAPDTIPLLANKRVASVPHPFVLEPPITTDTVFKNKDILCFNLLLFGEVNKKLPYFIYAFDQMGEIGIGKKINNKRSQFILNAVKYNNEIIYSKNDSTLKLPENIPCLSLINSNNIYKSANQLKIEFQTPLRLKFKNHLTEKLPFHVFVRSMLRRISALYEYYGNTMPNIEYKELVHNSQKVNVDSSDLNWIDINRYSFRQNISMKIGGIIGSVIYKGDITDFLPFIDMCENIHIGKQTTFGLGKFKAKILL